MKAIELANVNENTLYEIGVVTRHGKVKTRGTFFSIDIDANKVGIIPDWNPNILLSYDADSIVSVDGADGDNKGD